MGIDYLSIDQLRQHATIAAHHALLGAGVVVVEGLDLSEVEPGEYDMVCLPLRIAAATAPRRASSCARAPDGPRMAALVNVLLLRDVVAVLLAGGAGERLYPLTRDRAKPAVRFGGPYRIIDFTLSNCINSGLRKIFVATQYKAQSLNRHVRMGWSVVNRELGEFIEVLPPAEAGRRELVPGHRRRRLPEHLHASSARRPRWVIILSGDHIYKMDYGKMLDVHIARGAALTVGAIEVPLADARRFGVLEVDEDSRVIGFQEKPATARPTPWNPRRCLGSMGIYIFDTDVLVRELLRDAEEPHQPRLRQATSSRSLVAARASASTPTCSGTRTRRSRKYWRDVGTLDAYYEASMDLIQVDPVFNLYDPDWPLRTYQPQFPPAKFVFDEDGRRGIAMRVARLDGLHRLRQRGPALASCRPGVRVHSYCDDRGLDPHAQRHHQPPRAHPQGDHRPRGRGAARARSSATIPPRTGGATPSPRAAWWS